MNGGASPLDGWRLLIAFYQNWFLNLISLVSVLGHD